MTVQWDDTTRNAIGDAWETAIGTTPWLEFRSGAQPANCAAADSGTLIAEIQLASDWASAASGGVKTLTGMPLSDAAANADGTLGHYRVKNSARTQTREQGYITVTGGGGDMTVDNTSVLTGQQVNVTAWTKTVPGA